MKFEIHILLLEIIIKFYNFFFILEEYYKVCYIMNHIFLGIYFDFFLFILISYFKIL